MTSLMLACGSAIGIAATGLQPLRCVALQVAALITSIRGLFTFAAYSVPVARSTEIMNSCWGTLGGRTRQPEVFVALQRLTLTTDRIGAPPTFARYAVPVAGISANAFGLPPGLASEAARWFRATFGQPDLARPSHVLVLISDNVLSPWLIVNAVWTAESIATNWVAGPVVTATGARPQPAVILALHRAPLITDVG